MTESGSPQPSQVPPRVPLSLSVARWTVLCVGASSRLDGKAERLYRGGATLRWWQGLPPSWLGRPGLTAQQSWPEPQEIQLVLADSDDAGLQAQ
ncbi:MAG: hypothetical protein EA349_14610, partial [Halomonadaceae bacterium]